MLNVDVQIGSFIPLEEVFPEERASPESLKRLLQDLDKSEVIGLCAKLNLLVSDRLRERRGNWLESNFREQFEIATFLFEPEPRARIGVFFQKHPHSAVVFRGQLLELVRWAALYCANESAPGHLEGDAAKRSSFAKALLTVTSFWNQRVYRNQFAVGGSLTVRRLQLLPRFRRSVSESEKGPDLTQAFARGKSILVDYLCCLYPEFPSCFEAASGLALSDYYTCLLYLVLCSMGLWGNNVVSAPLNKNRSFQAIAERPDLQRSISRLTELRSQSVQELSSSLWPAGTDPLIELDAQILEHKVFREKPVVRLDSNWAIVLDPVFLAEMASMGPLFMSGDTEKSLRQFGHAFEAYCRDVLAGMYPTAPGLSVRLAPSTLGVTSSGGEVQMTDAILDCGDKTIFFETKACLIREDAIDSLDAQDYLKFLRKKYGASLNPNGATSKKGIAQLANAIMKLSTGQWRLRDTCFPIRKRIIPVLLVHDSLIDAPLHPWFLAREFAFLLDGSNTDLDKAVMQVGDYQVNNLIIMTIDDLENIESSVQNFDLGTLLQDYASNRRERLDSLHNYLVENTRYRDAIVYSYRLRTMFREELKDLGVRIGPPAQTPITL